MSGFDIQRLPFLLLCAAELIDANAQSLKEAHTTADGDWGGEAEALEYYESEMIIAADLRAAEKELTRPLALVREVNIRG